MNRRLVTVAFCTMMWLSASQIAKAEWKGEIDSEVWDGSFISFSSMGFGSITTSFAAQGGFPTYLKALVIADPTINGSMFSGDYLASGVESLTFRTASDGHSSRFIAVFLVGKDSNRLWYNPNVTVSSVQGDLTTNNITFNLSDGWTTKASGDLDTMWQQDLKDVGKIGVILMPLGIAAQSYTVDEFRLIGTSNFKTPPAGLTPMENALWYVFNKTSADQLTDAQRQQDGDGDGMTDLDEILSENDSSFANSIFVVETVAVGDPDGVTIKWACVAGATYTVFRSQDLMSGFHALTAATDIPAMNTGYMTYKDVSATGDGPYFYRIVK